MVKAYGIGFDEVLYGMSYKNLILYGAVLPSYSSKTSEKEGTEKPIRADDPKNNSKIRAILNL